MPKLDRYLPENTKPGDTIWTMLDTVTGEIRRGVDSNPYGDEAFVLLRSVRDGRIIFEGRANG